MSSNMKREVICYYRGNNSSHGFQNFDHTHRSYDPLQYPLLFPTGRDGWNLNVTSLSNNKKVTLTAFTSFHLMERNGIFNPIHFANKLGQQFIVDQYCKIEMDRLS